MDAMTTVVDRADFHTELDALRVLEKALTREADAIAASHHRWSRSTRHLGERPAHDALADAEWRVLSHLALLNDDA